MLQPSGSIVQLCHVVTNVDQAIVHWTETLQAGPFFVGEVRFEEGHFYRGEPAVLALRFAFGFSGGLMIELVQPLEGDRSAFSEALEKRGPGYHHVMLREDYDTAYTRLSGQGFEVALKNTSPLGERSALFDLQAVDGGFVEVMDLNVSFPALADAISSAHSNWDGEGPSRPIAHLFDERWGVTQSL